MIYLSIDCETTGIKCEKNQLLEVGVVIENMMEDTPVSDLPSFRAVIIDLRGEYNISPYVMRMHMETGLFDEIENFEREKFSDRGFWYEKDTKQEVRVYCLAEHLESCLLAWLKKHNPFTSKGKLVPAGKNFYGFDYDFLRPVLPSLRFHHRCLDPVMHFLKKTDRKPPDLQLCCERAGISMANYHTAVGDAQMVIELIRIGGNKNG